MSSEIVCWILQVLVYVLIFLHNSSYKYYFFDGRVGFVWICILEARFLIACHQVVEAPSPKSGLETISKDCHATKFVVLWSWNNNKTHPRPNRQKESTLPETNIAREKRPSQKESSVPTIHFQG